MAEIWTKGCAALVLISLSAPAAAAGPAKSARIAASKQTPIAHSRFDLGARTAQRRLETPRQENPSRPLRNAQFVEGEPAYIEGPSWSYQTSKRGPTFEMGALGGGATQDAPFLAHVAMGWKF